jgi:hypothetical protein
MRGVWLAASFGERKTAAPAIIEAAAVNATNAILSRTIKGYAVVGGTAGGVKASSASSLSAIVLVLF